MRQLGSLRTDNPWPITGWGAAAALIVVAGALGFGFLDRFQQGGPTLSLWNAICRGLGITADIGPASEPQPPLRTPTRIAWTGATHARIAAGNPNRGEFVAANCTACHGNQGISQSGIYPTLAGMDAAVIYKQLDDFRSGHRSWGAMNAIGQALSLEDSADVAAYFARQSGGLPATTGDRMPAPGRSLREANPAQRLVFAGDPRHSVPPCSACHGPGGYKLGAPALQGQQVNYIEAQLVAFAQGLRQNDISEQMRIIARGLTPDDMHAVAVFYGVPAGVPRAGGLALR